MKHRIAWISLAFSALAARGFSDDGAKISFQTWSMVGVQATYSTESENIPSRKGFDLDSVAFGIKSYNKFYGSFLPKSPFFVELALAESDLDELVAVDSAPIYLMRKDRNGNDLVSFADGGRSFFEGLYTTFISTIGQSTDNSNDNAQGYGSGSAAKLGHLKFGFDTPYLKFVGGFNYAKADVRSAVIWQTVGNGWDAGYQHVGGFNQFSIGDGAVKFLEDATGFRFTAGFAPNKTGDRKGTKFGHWGWIGLAGRNFVVDFQSNGLYNGAHPFEDSVEQDFILGAKNRFSFGRSSLNVAAQGVLSLFQKSFTGLSDSDLSNSADYFGYSTDAYYRSGKFDGIKNIAAQVRADYRIENFNVEASYRLRGFESSMLYVRENADDGTFDLSGQLGVLNSQNIDLRANLKVNGFDLALCASAKLPLEDLSEDSVFHESNYDLASGGIWFSGTKDRCQDLMSPMFNQKGGAEFTFRPEGAYRIEDHNLYLKAYGDLHVKSYTYADGMDSSTLNKYSASDSQVLLSRAGLVSNWDLQSDVVKGLDLFYGFDNSDSKRLLNSIVSNIRLSNDINVTAGIAVKTVKSTEAASSYDRSENNPFGFALGISRKFSRLGGPVVYAQFVYNTDIYRRFGEGQEQLALDRANSSSRWNKGAFPGSGVVNAVDYHDGKAALRAGIRWDVQ